MKTFVLCLLLVVSLGYVTARSLYLLKILPRNTQCHSDGTMTIYYVYLGYGWVYEDWNSGTKTCSRVMSTESVGLPSGWYMKCIVSSQSGAFTVKYNGGRLCDKNYDLVTYSYCRKSSHMCGPMTGK